MRNLFAGIALSLLLTATSYGQAVRPLPYSAQLKTDPAVGNVQGIQRYGRPLKTDPDQGVGFSYHVYPVSDSQTAMAVTQDANGGASNGGGGRVRAAEVRARVQALSDVINEHPELQDQFLPEIQRLEKEIENTGEIQGATSDQTSVTQAAYAQNAGSSMGVSGPLYGTFDWTDGIRNTQAPDVVLPSNGDEALARAIGIDRKGLTFSEHQIYHQPLIQIKLRVVEVARTDGLQVASALEYVSNDDMENSLTSGRTANDGKQNVRGATTFDLAGLITTAGTGQGALVNLTSEHINWLLQAIAVEQNADVITAPEVVTLNGQNVEFVSGEKLPFELGQNVINGNGNNIQQVFYKHVGTMVSVTPRIVNWGLHGEGQGEGSLQANDVLDWPGLLKAMEDSKLKFQYIKYEKDAQNNTIKTSVNIANEIGTYKNQPYVPFSIRRKF